MKILHVHDFFAPGNSRYGFDMNRMLVERGHTLHVLAGTGELGPSNGSSIENIIFHTYPYAFEKNALGKIRYGIRQNRQRFTELQKAHSYDAVILNQPLCAAGVLKSPEARKIAKVYSFISPWAEEWRITNPDAGRFKRWVNYTPRKMMERRALERVDHVIVESRFIQSELHRLYPDISEFKVHMIPGAVDLDRFSPNGSAIENRKKLGLPEDKVILLTLRRLVPRMGIESLVWALRKIPDVFLAIGGEGPIRHQLEELADKLDMAHRVKFLGYVKEEEIQALYRSADLFVLPTRALEGFGLVAIEAMACGTPAAGTPVGAIPEVLGDLDSRLVLPGMEPEQIRKGILTILEDKELLSSLRSRCRDYVASRYNWRTMAEKVEQVIQLATGL